MYGLLVLNFIIPFVMVFVGYILKKLHIPQELRIRSGGTERHSASN